MDKTSRALIGVEDNAEDIRALKARMQENADALNDRIESVEVKLEKIKIIYKTGQSKPLGTNTYTSFGKYRIDGPTIFVILMGDTNRRETRFGDDSICSAVGSTAFKLDSGEGDIRIYPLGASARLLVVGDAVQI